MLERTLIIHQDGRDTEAMMEEGLANMDAFVAVTGRSETNILTAMEMQKEIVNFMFTNVYKDIVRYEFEVKLSTGETRCGYLQFKQ